MFVFDQIRVADEGDGADLDSRCQAEGRCADNGLWMVGSAANERLEEDLAGGALVLLVELAGLDVELGLDDPAVTLKFYTDHQLGEAGEARVRIPARIRNGRLETFETASVTFPLTVGLMPQPFVEVERFHTSARLVPRPDDERDLPEGAIVLSDVLVGFAIPMGVLAGLDNPYCESPNQLCPRPLSKSSMLDLVTNFVQPDVDLDGEPGLETVVLGGEGRVAECLDERGATVPPMQTGEPWSCAVAPRMGDGYSIALRGSAVPASLLGFR